MTHKAPSEWESYIPDAKYKQQIPVLYFVQQNVKVNFNKMQKTIKNMHKTDGEWLKIKAIIL